MGLISGLSAYWKMDAASTSAQRLDSHGTNHITPNVALPLVAAVIDNGTGLPNTAAGESLTCPHAAGITSSPAGFSVTLWLKCGTFTTFPIINKSNDYRLDFRAGSSNFAKFFFGTTIGVQSITLTPVANTFLSSEYVFVALRYDPTTAVFSVRVTSAAGTVQQSSFPGLTPQGFSSALTFGGAVTNSNVVDEMAFWQRYLEDTEIDTLYNDGTGLTYDDFPSGLNILANESADTASLTLTENAIAAIFGVESPDTLASIFTSVSPVSSFAQGTGIPLRGDTKNILLNRIVRSLSQRRGGLHAPRSGDTDNELMKKWQRLNLI